MKTSARVSAFCLWGFSIVLFYLIWEVSDFDFGKEIKCGMELLLYYPLIFISAIMAVVFTYLGWMRKSRSSTGLT